MKVIHEEIVTLYAHDVSVGVHEGYAVSLNGKNYMHENIKMMAMVEAMLPSNRIITILG